MNPDGDDALFSDITMDDASLMLVDDILGMIKSEPDLEKADVDQIDAINKYGSVNGMEQFGGASVSNEITDTTIDPNDFFNDIYKSEVDYSSTFSSPAYRSTPSPTTSNSSQSSDHLSVDYNSASNQSEASINLYNIQHHSLQPNTHIQTSNNFHLETPPISPPSDIVSLNSQALSYIQPAQSIPVLNHVVSNTTDSKQPINIIQGTLIPITAVSLATSPNGTNIINTNSSQLKKVKIQPKPVPIATKPNSIATVKQAPQITPKTLSTPKRIVLSGNDYKNLFLKCKTQQVGGIDGQNCAISGGAVTTLQTQANESSVFNVVSTNTSAVSNGNLNTTATTQVNAQPINATNVNNLMQITPLSQNRKPKLKSLQDEIDERTLKKQMRMIKNRESACLSRKKKKEYVNTLEARIMDLSKENQNLKSENYALKERLGQVTNKICDMCGNLMSDKGSKGMDTLNLIRSVPKKNAAFLLAFVFMVSLNVGPYISPRTPNFRSYSGADNSLMPHNRPPGTRGLLWIDDGNDITNTSTVSDNSESDRTYPMCPASSVNQSESIRLATELQRWIGDLPEFLNLTKFSSQSKEKLDLTKFDDFLLSDEGSAAIKSFYKQIKNVRQMHRKIANGIETGRKMERMSASMKRRHQSIIDDANRRNSINTNDYGKHVQIYSPAYSHAMKYATFFEEIHRQDDTFYVVSFRADHLLLPALAHNKTFRPKMALMLPAWNLNNNNNASTDGLVTLMHIDCEVLNTSMIQIRESSIPDSLRNRTSMPNQNMDDSIMDSLKPSGNEQIRPRQPSTSESNEQPKAANITFDTTLDDFEKKKTDTSKKYYKPYFIGNRADARYVGN